MLKLSFAALLVVWWWVFVWWAGSTTFSNLKATTSASNAISAESWNALLDWLDTLQQQIDDITWQVPKWAVVAFTGSCPTWWGDYSNANWRFVLWSSITNAGKKTSSTVTLTSPENWVYNITLTPANLPAHSHAISLWWRWTNIWNWTKFVSQLGNAHPWTAWTYSTTSVYTDPTGSWTAINVVNPYVILHYCIKN